MPRRGNLGSGNGLQEIIDMCWEEKRVYEAGLAEGMVEQGEKELNRITERNLGKRVETLDMALG